MSTKSIHISNKAKRGFTLIELLVVIAIIGLLAAAVILTVTKVRASSRDSKRKMDLKQIQVALEMYYDINKGYPDTGGKDNFWSSCDGTDGWIKKDANEWVPGLVPDFIASLPLDPIRGNRTGAISNPANPVSPFVPWPTEYAFCYIYAGTKTDYVVADFCSAENEVLTSDNPLYQPGNAWGYCNQGLHYTIYTPGATNW